MHEIELSPTAFKFLERLKRRDRVILERIIRAIDRLKGNPYLGKSLVGELADFRTLRVGDCRIIYTVVAKKLLVQIIKIGHRREIYR